MDILSKREISNLDIWIEQLKCCLPLEESNVKYLCEKVKYIYKLIYYQINRQKKYLEKKKIFY